MQKAWESTKARNMQLIQTKCIKVDFEFEDFNCLGKRQYIQHSLAIESLFY